MFEPNPNSGQYFGFFSRSYPANENAHLVNRAVRLFNTAISRGRFESFKRWITRKSGQLLDLNSVCSTHVRAQYYGGVRAVALKNIRGSLGRTGALIATSTRSTTVRAIAGKASPWLTCITPS